MMRWVSPAKSVAAPCVRTLHLVRARCNSLAAIEQQAGASRPMLAIGWRRAGGARERPSGTHGVCHLAARRSGGGGLVEEAEDAGDAPVLLDDRHVEADRERLAGAGRDELP